MNVLYGITDALYGTTYDTGHNIIMSTINGITIYVGELYDILSQTRFVIYGITKVSRFK